MHVFRQLKEVKVLNYVCGCSQYAALSIKIALTKKVKVNCEYGEFEYIKKCRRENY